MKAKKFLALLLSLTMLLGLCTVGAKADSDTAEVASLAELNAALADSNITTIKLTGDITGDPITNPSAQTATVTVGTGKTLTLDLNGHTISTALTTDGNSYHLAHVVYVNGGNLTITDTSEGMTGELINTNSSSHFCTRVVLVTGNGTLTMNGGTVTATSGEGMRIDNATVTLNEGATVQALTGGDDSAYGWDNAVAGIEVRGNAHVLINGATVKSSGQNAIYSDQASDEILIQSGALYGSMTFGVIGGDAAQKTIRITGGYFRTDPSDYLDTIAYKTVVQDGGTYNGYYQVVERVLTPHTVNTFAELKSVLDNATFDDAVAVTLGADIEITSPVRLLSTSSLTIPEGFTLSVTGEGVLLNDGKITNNGTISTSGDGFVTHLLDIEGEGGFAGYPESNAPYTVSTAMDLEWLSWKNRSAAYVTDVVLANDVTFPDGAEFDPIGLFVGKFDGCGYTIDNLTLRSTSADLGLFAVLGNSALDTTVKNLTINETLTTKNARCGGLAAKTSGKVHISKVTMNGTMTATGATYYFAPFVGYAYNNNHHIYFGDCTTNMTVTANSGANIGPIIGSTGNGQSFKIGVYNFTNTGTISATGANNSVGYVMGYSMGASAQNPITVEVINYKNTGSITNNYGTYTNVGTGSSWLCCNDGSGWGANVYQTAYIDTSNTAYYHKNEDIYNTERAFIAMIGEIPYETLAGALEAAQSDDTIVLQNDAEISENTTLNNTIDFSDCTLTVKSGTLTITGGSYNGRIVKNGGELSITGGTFTTNPNQYVAEGYVGNMIADDKYVVGPIVEIDSTEETATVTDEASGVSVTFDTDSNNQLTQADAGLNTNESLALVVESKPKNELNSYDEKITEVGATVEDVIDITVQKTTVTKDANTGAVLSTTTENVEITNVTSTVSYYYPNYDSSKVYKVYYFPEIGTPEDMNATYNPVTKSFEFVVNHNSEYGVVSSSINESNKTDKIEVAFKPTAEANVYDIVLLAEDAKYIHGFTSADLTFQLDIVEGNPNCVTYVIDPVAGMTTLNDSKAASNRYEFNMDGIHYDRANGANIKIGTVTFLGYGKIDFKVTDDATNVVNTTKLNDSIVEQNTVAGGVLMIDALNPTTDANPSALINDLLLSPVAKSLTVNVMFPNDAANNAKAYQDMTMTISGGDLYEDIVINLGNDPAVTGKNFMNQPLVLDTDVTVAYNGSGSYGATPTSCNQYAVSIPATLHKDIRYTVTVSGAGYRSARYSLNMTGDKTLTFWNNVMDDDTVIETGNDATKVKVTYLAGDIVQDAQINIYDLSAVVSYFGAVNTTSAASDYAKYDLNRDGKIDSIDVAYVLVSWGK